MAGRRNRVIRDNDIIDFLADSDGDFIPSDEDLGDPPFVPELDRNPTDSEENADSSDDEEPIPSHSLSVTRGNLRGRGPRGRIRRGGIRRGRIRRGRIRRGLISRQSIPSASGSTAEWVTKDFVTDEELLSQPSYLPNVDDDFNKFDFFLQYIDVPFVEVIVDRTNQTAVAATGRSLNLVTKELFSYIGITFIMAAISYPSLKMYWEAKWRVPLIANNMSRNRFTLLRNSLKVVFDGDVTEEMKSLDKLWKMRPLVNRIQQGCRLQEKEQRMSIDEMIIPFTGSCGMKQYCPGKPNPVGLKAFVLANPNGIVTDFDIYQGNTTYPQLQDTDFGLGEKAVLSLADSLVPGHIVYCDRYFTTVKLARELKKRGIRCTGTIQKNRVPASARSVLIDDKELSRRGRGSMHTIVSEDDAIAITKWNDNKPVTVLSTIEAEQPVDFCQRWCKRTKRYVTVDRPAVIREYNKNMGGVDLADRMLSVCPNRYRTKKWTQRFFSHMIDLAVSNSWLQYKKRELAKGIPLKKIQQLRYFKLDLGECIIEANNIQEENNSDDSNSYDAPETRRKRGRPTTELPSKKQRTSSAKHMPIMVDTQSRCRHCHFNKSRTKCSTCNTSLCLTKDRNCYALFHNE